jgi:hypothetical protein
MSYLMLENYHSNEHGLYERSLGDRLEFEERRKAHWYDRHIERNGRQMANDVSRTTESLNPYGPTT